jgi:hypothetical protein
MNESSYLTLLGKLEHSDGWGFGDAFELISNYSKPLGSSHSSDQAQWDKIYNPISDIWTLFTNAIQEGSIGIKSGELTPFLAGPMNGIFPDITKGKGKNKITINKGTNSLVIDRKSFLDWYLKNKGKLIQYLSSANLEINKEDFLDRLASVKQPSKGGRPEFPYKEEVKQAVENLLKNKPNITQGKIPFMPEIVNVLAPGKAYKADNEMSEKKYKELFGCSISTIKKIVREAYKSNS